jgi:hypothetical protein
MQLQLEALRPVIVVLFGYGQQLKRGRKRKICKKKKTIESNNKKWASNSM